MKAGEVLTPSLGADAAANAQVLQEIARRVSGTQGVTLRLPEGVWPVADSGAIQRWEDYRTGKLEKGDLQIVLNTIRSTPTLMRIDDCSELTIEAEGAELIFEGSIQPIEFQRCANLSIRGLTIDWKRPLFSVAKVTDISGDLVSLETLDPFPLEGGEAVN